mgnify:CR=1 FL=1
MERQEVDVLVVGSGAGGLSSAVAAAHRRLNVLVVEKEPVFGGTTARSGGWMWIPGNGPELRAGIDDNAEKARIYLQHEAGDHFDAERVDSFLEAGPKAVKFFEENTALQFDLGPFFADYHPDAPGGMDGGRSIVARPFDGRELGPGPHPPAASTAPITASLYRATEMVYPHNAKKTHSDSVPESSLPHTTPAIHAGSHLAADLSTESPTPQAHPSMVKVEYHAFSSPIRKCTL